MHNSFRSLVKQCRNRTLSETCRNGEKSENNDEAYCVLINEFEIGPKMRQKVVRFRNVTQQMFSFTEHLMHFTQDERKEKVYVGGIKIFIEKRKAVLSSLR